MSTFTTLLRRLRDLVARLLGRGAAADATARAALPAATDTAALPSPPPADPAPQSLLVAVPEPAPAAATVSQSSAAPAASTISGLATRVLVEPAVDASVVASLVRGQVADPDLAPADDTGEGPAIRGEALVPGARPVLTVRRFFARVAAVVPGGLTVDFSAWQDATVDRFFLALTSPERTRRRGPALAETTSLSGAFDGFEWD